MVEAEALLTSPERDVLARFHVPKRRHDWLLGRLAAKRAVCAATGDRWTPDVVTVLAGPANQPTFTGPDDSLTRYTLTITHGHGWAGAVVAPGPVGLDLEEMRAVEPGGWRFFLSEAERAWLASEPLGAHGEIVFWAVKEAAFKALAGAVDSMPKLHATIGHGTASLIHAGGTVAARWHIAHGLCLAVAAPAPAPAWLDDVALRVPIAP